MFIISSIKQLIWNNLLLLVDIKTDYCKFIKGTGNEISKVGK